MSETNEANARTSGESAAYDELFLEEEGEEEVAEPEVDELAAAKAEIAELNDKLLRLRADQQNLRRRHDRERQDLLKYGAEGVLKEIVLVMDDLDRALSHLSDGEATGSLLEGVKMVHRKFEQTLERQGVTKVAAEGKPFDPNVHEALQQVDDDSVPHNHVLRVFQSGFKLHDRLLRPSLVVVGRGGPEVVVEEEEA